MIDVWPALFSPGVHDVTLNELEIISLQDELATPRRVELFGGLRRYLQELAETGVRVEVWVDGSFTTRKPDPSDIDIILFLHENSTLQLSKGSHDALDVLIDVSGTSQRYELDLNVEIFGDDVMAAYWRGKFGFYADQTTPKGIVVLQMGGGIT